MTYAVETINAAGGVKGRKIEVVTRDTQGNPTKAVKAVQEMTASYTVHVIWGPNNSGESLATTPIISRRGIPNIHSCGITSLIGWTSRNTGPKWRDPAGWLRNEVETFRV